MKKIFRNSIFMLTAGMLAVSCADYNVTDNFKADPDPEFSEPYRDLKPVKSYIDRDKYTNMTLGATLTVTEFNKKELSHAAAITNFDNLAFGTTLMSGSIIKDNGLMNFLDMKELLDHVEEIGGEVFGSPLAANENQPDGWLALLTSPIEIQVSSIHDKSVDYTKMSEFKGTVKSGKPKIEVRSGVNALSLPKKSKVYIIEDFDVETLGKYTITFYAQVDKDETVSCTFADSVIYDGKDKKKYNIKAGGWKKVVIEDVYPAKGATNGYLMLEGNLNSIVYIRDVTVVHYPDNHRPQTEQEINDTINYAMKSWCEGVMKYNEGRIKSFDLIDEPIDATSVLENGMYDLKHSTDKIFWQDIFGSEKYAPTVAKYAKAAYEKNEGDPNELKFFIAESNLDDDKKLESLNYWINVWDQNGAKIDGINAKVNLTFSEDPTKQAENKANLDKLLTNLANLAATGKLIRLSNFDIKYQDASGKTVTTTDLTIVRRQPSDTDEEWAEKKAQNEVKLQKRQLLADYYKYAIQSYMNKIPNDKQAGLCKGNIVDNADPVGLWTNDRDYGWTRTATYKAFCDALSGK